MKKTYSNQQLEEKILKALEEEMEAEYEISKYEEKYKKRNVYTKEVSQGLYGDACTCILNKIFFSYCIVFVYHHLLPFSPLS